MSNKASDSEHPLDPVPFEVFHEGCWHSADLISIQNGNISVRTRHPISTTLVNIHPDFYRMRSRKATYLDCCNFLKPGIDVSVVLPVSSNSNQESQPQQWAWVYARIIKIKRSHADTCNCLFAIMPYKSDGLIHMRNLVGDHAHIVLVKIAQISILQKLKNKADEYGNILACSTQNETSIYKTVLFNFSDNFSAAIATLIALSTSCGVFEIKVVQGRIVYHVPEDYVNEKGSNMKMKVVNFVNYDGVIKPKVEQLSIGHACKEEGNASTRGLEDSVEILETDNVYEEINIRRSKRIKFQPNFFSGSSYAPSAEFYSSSKSQPKKEPVKEGVTLQNKHEMKSSSVQDVPKQKAAQRKRSFLSSEKHGVKKEEYACTEECTEFIEKLVKDLETSDERGPYWLHEKYGVKVKYFKTKKDDDLIDQLIKEQPTYKKRGWPYQLHEKNGAKKNYSNDKECDDFIEELITDIKCCRNKKSEPVFQQEWETCAPSSDYYPIEEDFTWSPTDSDGEIEKEKEKDEHEELWKDMDYCLNTLAVEEEKKNYDSDDEVVSEKDKEEMCLHDCVLDEQLGYICTKCSVVTMEIRDVFPPVMKERSYQILKDKDHTKPKLDPSEINPSLLKTDPNSRSSKSSNNIWTPIFRIEPKLKPHQRKAFEFIWKNLVGSLEPAKISSTNGSTGGCVISHSPGSGKTLTVISFLISYLAVFPRSCPLVLTPKSAMHTWESEFRKWDVDLPVYIIKNNKDYRKRASVGKMKGFLDSHRLPSCKKIWIMDLLEKVRLWYENSGVLLMPYSSFLSLMKVGSRNNTCEFIANVLETSPGLLVLDEGHNPRSTSSKLRRLLMKVNTESRILLSGTVFQNNFEEYFNTLCLARPRFMRDALTELETKTMARETRQERKTKTEEKHAQKLFVEKIGRKIESHNRWDQKHGFELLRKMTSGFINAFDGDMLLNLPDLEAYNVFLQCTEPQEKVLQTLQNSYKSRSQNHLEIEFLVSLGTIHPSLVSKSRFANKFFTDKELKEISRKKSFSRSSKTSFVISVILKSLLRNERVLIFCHNLEPLKLLIKLIESNLKWHVGKEILFLNGDQDLSVRFDTIDRFNEEGNAMVLLASTNACAEGISLIAASRIVLLDSEWNPSKTKQAIARAFRLGQKKKVFVYLLLAAGSMEESKYESNKKKAWVSKMVSSGTCVENSSAKLVTGADITDELLREIVEEETNSNKTIKMVFKH